MFTWKQLERHYGNEEALLELHFRDGTFKDSEPASFFSWPDIAMATAVDCPSHFCGSSQARESLIIWRDPHSDVIHALHEWGPQAQWLADCNKREPGPRLDPSDGRLPTSSSQTLLPLSFSIPLFLSLCISSVWCSLFIQRLPYSKLKACLINGTYCKVSPWGVPSSLKLRSVFPKTTGLP